MTDAFQPNLDFTAAEQVDEREAFVVDLDGYEGPLHVLLALARTQKVDLLKLSITRLAEQYLAFVHEARRRNFSLAAGCDMILHCNGRMDEMQAVVAGARPLAGKAKRRADAALARLARSPEPFDVEAAIARFDAAFDRRFAA